MLYYVQCIKCSARKKNCSCVLIYSHSILQKSWRLNNNLQKAIAENGVSTSRSGSPVLVAKLVEQD